MNLFDLLTEGQLVRFVPYADEITLIPQHMKTIGEIVGIGFGWYAVKFGKTVETIDNEKLEAVQ